jgi:hypothetical protein
MARFTSKTESVEPAVSAVLGIAPQPNGGAVGVTGTSEGGVGVAGLSTKSTGVQGIHGAPDPLGSVGTGLVSGTAGVFGASDDGPGLMGYSDTGPAGDFWGDVHIRNNLVVDGDLFLPGADCAELFAAVEQIDPGDVVIINRDGVLRRSDTAYDKRVAGVASGAGRFRPGMILDSRNAGSDRSCPLALIGKVYCKVDARPLPIEVGDLLTTSMTPGHAMKAARPSDAFGAVLGKALADLDSGTGLLPILVCLQ